MDTTKAPKDKISCRKYSHFSLILEASFANSFLPTAFSEIMLNLEPGQDP